MIMGSPSEPKTTAANTIYELRQQKKSKALRQSLTAAFGNKVNMYLKANPGSLADARRRAQGSPQSNQSPDCNAGDMSSPQGRKKTADGYRSAGLDDEHQQKQQLAEDFNYQQQRRLGKCLTFFKMFDLLFVK